MKKIILLLLVVGGSLNFNGQSKKNDLSLGIHLGTKQYRGDIGNEFFKFENVTLAGGISITKYLNKSFNAMALASYGRISHSNQTEGFNTSVLDFNGAFQYKLANGYILKEDALISPYVFAGLGTAYSVVKGDVNSGNMDFNFPVGLGFDVRLSEKMSLNLMTSFNQSLSDKYDGVKENKNLDQFLFSAIGLKFNFSSEKDADEDGVVDSEDKCPDTAGLLALMGCPDADGDGVADADDQCPKEAGTLDGCPDSDGDGVADSSDKCPNEAGTLEGCPDNDGDGIANKEDRCPEVKGTIELKGCVDTDGDGFADIDDQCPAVAGTLKGCPDSDGDGVANNVDKCPNLSGVAKNKGCPEISSEEAAVMTTAMEGLFFKSGSAVIKTSSYKVLDNVSKVMNAHTEYVLLVSGHTDSSGDAAKNLLLSQNRAKAAKDYLIKKGVDGSRIKSEGFGITKPVADNANPEGRAKNRRVEFKIEF